MKRFIALIVGVTVSVLTPASPATETVFVPVLKPGDNPAAVARPRNGWYETVQKKFDRFSGKHADVVFDGDSITNRWEEAGKAVWDAHFAQNSADFGIDGDCVENVLWRLQQGQVDGVDPKVVVLMIGTNNLLRDTPEQIAEGTEKVVQEYLKRCPHAQLILMALLPRGAKPTFAVRGKAEAVNALTHKITDSRLHYVDIGAKLIESDGTISPKTLPDSIHPSERTYQLWADSIEPMITDAEK